MNKVVKNAGEGTPAPVVQPKAEASVVGVTPSEPPPPPVKVKTNVAVKAAINEERERIAKENAKASGPVCPDCKGSHRVQFKERRGLVSVGPCKCVKA